MEDLAFFLRIGACPLQMELNQMTMMAKWMHKISAGGNVSLSGDDGGLNEESVFAFRAQRMVLP